MAVHRGRPLKPRPVHSEQAFVMPVRFKPDRRTVGKLAASGAWFFIVVSLLHLLWAIGVKWAEPAGTYKLYHTVVGDVSYDAWGLTYTGVLGLLTAMAQALVVTAAAVASSLPFEKTLKARKAGHLVLVGWSAMWTLNLIWLAGIDHQLDSIAQATLLGVLFAGTAWRAYVGWSPRRSRRIGEPPRGEPLWLERLVPAPPAAAEIEEQRDRGKDPFSARVAQVMGRLVSLVQTVVGRMVSFWPRVRYAGQTERRKTAVGLNRVADFTHRQADRVAPDTSECA